MLKSQENVNESEKKLTFQNPYMKTIFLYNHKLSPNTILLLTISHSLVLFWKIQKQLEE